MPNLSSSAKVSRFAWYVAWYVGAVILLGAVVRVTGSGAGCGKHWPTCQGEVFLLPHRIETIIELSHRLTSAVSLLAVLGLVAWTRRRFPQGHTARRAANYSLLFIIVESLIGAVLVVFGLVVGDASLARAVMVPVHLVNASCLMASLVLSAHFAHDAAPGSELPSLAKNPQIAWVLVALLVTSMLGAVTALGDTLFPPNLQLSLAQRLKFDQSAQAHFLERLRVIHPAIALATAFFSARTAVVVAIDTSQPARARALSYVCIVALLAQCLAGAVNVWLGAPPVMQVFHLGIALFLFGSFVLLWARVEGAAAHPLPMSSPSTAP